MVVVRFADDFVAGFEHHTDAQRFLADLRERFAQFGLELHPDKTRLIEFGRFAAHNRKARGDGKPETFDFLGFTHICGKARNGRFWLRRITISKRMRAKLADVKDQLKQRRHLPIPEQGRWLGSVVRGHHAYYAVPGNSNAAEAFRAEAIQHWFKALRRRSQRHTLTWERMRRLVLRWIPSTRIPAPTPLRALRRPHPRQEPSAVVPLAGICAGGRPQGRSLPRFHNRPERARNEGQNQPCNDPRPDPRPRRRPHPSPPSRALRPPSRHSDPGPSGRSQQQPAERSRRTAGDPHEADESRMLFRDSFCADGGLHW